MENKFVKSYTRSRLHLINIYVTQYTPVDDFDFMGLPVTYQKTKLHSFIVASENFSTDLQPLEQILNMEFEIQLNDMREYFRRADSVSKGEYYS